MYPTYETISIPHLNRIYIASCSNHNLAYLITYWLIEVFQFLSFSIPQWSYVLNNILIDTGAFRKETVEGVENRTFV